MPDAAIYDTVRGLHLERKLGKDINTIVQAIRSRRETVRPNGDGVTLPDLVQREYEALRHSEPAEDERFDFSVFDEGVADGLKQVIGSVRRVERLRVVQVLRGFTRLDPPGTDSRLSVNVAPISKKPGGSEWLPAVELRGEGIFLELNMKSMRAWEQGEMPIARAARINRQYIHMCESRQWTVDREITPRFLLVHTLAHLLIRQFSLVCGYSSAALKERLYVRDASGGDSGFAAFLIYTATTDSEGSLGGLVQQASPDVLKSLVLGALEEASWCSSDPLCIESDGQGFEALNLAACHACALLPETCCEEYNRLLDRAMLVGTPGTATGFFTSVIQSARLTTANQ